MLVTALVVLPQLVACAPTGRQGHEPGSISRDGAPVPDAKTLVVVIQLESKTFAHRFSFSGGRWAQRALFNAGLAYLDQDGSSRPLLAASLPQLNGETWRLFPDGRMETTYRLRTGLSWHDGAPFTADDVVFTRQVVRDPTPGLFPLQPEDKEIEAVLATDASTLVIRWRGAFQRAGSLYYAPLPRHLLEAAFEQGDPTFFANHAYWAGEYVQLGPYRLQRWEPGAYVEAAAFDRYALGRPKIERVKLIWSADPNVAVAYLLSGQAHVAVDNAITLDSASTLRREWADGRGGSVVLSADQVRYLQVQFRREHARPSALLDPRVRAALMHAMDRKALADVILEGQGREADMYLPPNVDYYASAERAIAKYPYDARRADQALGDAGLAKGADGFYAPTSSGRPAERDAGPAQGRFDPELRARAGLESQEATIILDSWRRAGIDASLAVISAAQTSDQEARSTFPGLASTFTNLGVDSVYGKFVSSAISAPDNRWTGINRGGWSSPELDRLHRSFGAAMDREEQVRMVVETMKLLTEELPGLPLYYGYDVAAHAAALHGLVPIAPDSTAYANIHLWEWR